MSRSTIRVLIVDEHPVVRAGMQALLSKHADIEIIGEAEDGATTLSLVETLRPDVVTLETSLPDIVATRLTQNIRSLRPATQVLIFTAQEDPFYVHAVLDAGARGYLAKRASLQLYEAISSISRGERYICRVAAAAIAKPTVPAKDADDPIDPSLRGALARLSPREKLVLTLLAQGNTYREIAERLGVGVNSVGTYRARLAQKLGVQGRQELVRLAVASGLVLWPTRRSASGSN